MTGTATAPSAEKALTTPPHRRGARLGVHGLGYASTPAVLCAALLAVAFLRADYLFTSSGAGGAIVTAAPLILAAMALTPTALAGHGVDLSVGPVVIFVNVVLVRFLFERGVNAPLKVIACALLLGVAVQLVQGGIILLARIDPIIVTLSSFLIFAGLDLMILPQASATAPEWLAGWGAGRSVVTPMSILLLIAFAAWFMLMRTPYFTALKFTGSNVRTAYVRGLPVTAIRLLAHGISGLFIGAAGLAYTGLIGSGNPAQGTAITLTAVTALVLGGTSLAGGRGGATGSVLAAVAVFLVSYVLGTFNFQQYSAFVVQLANGLVLSLALLLGGVVPILRNRLNTTKGETS
jgi:ribose transport system permease protein